MHFIAVCLLIALPWLNPFSPGPSSVVAPWLLTLGCLALILLWSAPVRLDRCAASAWLSAALISAAIGLLQYFGAASALAPWVNSTEVGEAFANLRQRNQFATLTNIGLAALLWWNDRLRMEGTGAARRSTLAPSMTATMLAAILLALGNAASSSRTGMVQLLLLLVLHLIWRRPVATGRASAGWSVLLVAAMAYAVAAFALPALGGLDAQSSGILGRLHEGAAQCTSRTTLWSNVLQLIAQKPWLGWGWGELDYAHFITLYPGERFCDILDNAHNLPLHLAVELGVPLSLAVCALGGYLLWRARPWAETDATRQMVWAVLALILLHSMLEYPLWYGPFQMAFGLSIWLLWRAPDRATRASASVSLVPGVLAASLALAVAYAGWDYRRVSQIYLSAPHRAAAYRDNTLEKIRDSWLYSNQVGFAELTMSELTPENAAYLHDLAAKLLHFSPEGRVVEKLIESATLLGRKDEALFYQARYQAAFPESYALWLRESAGRP
ncbi:MAG: Wzy polymerase domain-containing protein [Burkholderiales bacterium]|nr:Wzy polymerase domain-containing protein [Burkholderiales bacterium]